MQKLLLGLIGTGIQRSLAPMLQEEEGRHHGLRMHYQLIDAGIDAADSEHDQRGHAPEAFPCMRPRPPAQAPGVR